MHDPRHAAIHRRFCALADPEREARLIARQRRFPLAALVSVAFWLGLLSLALSLALGP